MKYLQISLPKDLHRAFKKFCFEQDKTMTEVIISFIKKVVDKYKQT